MNSIIQKLRAYQKTSILIGILFLSVVSIAFALSVNDPVDADQDGVLDSVDMCLNTQPDASSDWGTNRYLWFGGDTNFFVVLNSEGSKVLSEFNSEQTKGCSCFDILKTRNTADTSGQYKSGCSRGTLEQWINKVNK